MNKFSKIALWVMLTAIVALPAWAIDTSKLKPTGYVNDFSNTLDAASKQSLEDYCANLERVTGVQMAIVLVPTIDDEPVEDVANRLFREWGIGKKGKDEGILLLFAMKEHKSRAEIGYGVEPIITDGAAGGILRQIRPILQQGNYGGALMAAAQQIGNTIAQSKGVELGGPEPVRNRNRGAPVPSIPFPLILLGLFFLLWLLSRGGSGGGTGFLTGMLLGNMMGRRGGWGGGGFGGYDGGGGGGGGFGGFGGGDSGGGGAAGSW
jgi:uncharacterized protein